MSRTSAGTRIIRAFDGAVRALEMLGAMAAALIMFLIMMIVIVDVCLRYLFNSPLDGAYELITLYLVAALFFLSLSHTLQRDHHVRVDVLFKLVSPRSRAAMEFVGYGLSLALFALVFDRGVRRTWEDWTSSGIIDGAYAWPTWIASAVVPIGVGMLLLRLLACFIESGLGAIAPDSRLAAARAGANPTTSLSGERR